MFPATIRRQRNPKEILMTNATFMCTINYPEYLFTPDNFNRKNASIGKGKLCVFMSE